MQVRKDTNFVLRVAGEETNRFERTLDGVYSSTARIFDRNRLLQLFLLSDKLDAPDLLLVMPFSIPLLPSQICFLSSSHRLSHYPWTSLSPSIVLCVLSENLVMLALRSYRRSGMNSDLGRNLVVNIFEPSH